MSSVIAGLKSFLIYLYENKHIASELVSALPGYPAKRRKHFVGFTREQARALIDSIPSDTNCGKRNFVSFTLAENTGLRAVDIVNLKLRDIDWRNKVIFITQHKTARTLILPFGNHVGDVLAEYILHYRPKSDSPFIFLSTKRPFSPINAYVLSSAMSKYIKHSGIGDKNTSLRKGMYCFRRGIGTWLLEAELPLTMISEILGHAHINSAKPYLSTNLEKLRECAVSLEGIEIRKGELQ
jgi:integrase